MSRRTSGRDSHADAPERTSKLQWVNLIATVAIALAGYFLVSRYEGKRNAAETRLTNINADLRDVESRVQTSSTEATTAYTNAQARLAQIEGEFKGAMESLDIALKRTLFSTDVIELIGKFYPNVSVEKTDFPNTNDPSRMVFATSFVNHSSLPVEITLHTVRISRNDIGVSPEKKHVDGEFTEGQDFTVPMRACFRIPPGASRQDYVRVNWATAPSANRLYIYLTYECVAWPEMARAIEKQFADVLNGAGTWNSSFIMSGGGLMTEGSSGTYTFFPPALGH